MQIPARQSMPLAGFYGSELMNAANEPGSNKDVGKGHYSAHVPAPAPAPAAPAPPDPSLLQCIVACWSACGSTNQEHLH